MKDGTREDYLLLQRLEKPHLTATADRILYELGRMAEDPAVIRPGVALGLPVAA